MAFIRSIDSISKKWAEVTPLRAGDYEAGIRNPRRSWKQATVNAEGAYEDGVRQGISRKAFGKGVSKAGDEKWQRKSLTRGVPNWGPGVADAEGDYNAGFAPYREAIAAVKLPPRYARRDPRNMARVKAIVDALIARKESLMGK
jgi:hypothetical protein